MQKKYIIFLSLLILIIAGCTSGKNNKVPDVGFIGGTEGLVPKLEIISSQPNEVLDNDVEPFQIALSLQNKGEHTVAANEVITTLAGIDLNAFQIIEKDGVSKNLDQLEKLRKEGGNLIPASETAIVYEASYKYDEPTDKVQDLAVNFCYKYRTTATADACLKKEVTRPSTESLCKIDDKKVVGNSGAPVSVFLLTERPAGKNQLTFTIQVKNNGKGDVYAQDFLSKGKCIEDQPMKNKLNVKVEFPDGNPVIKCGKLNDKNEGTISMIQNTASLSCTVDTSTLQDSAFTKSLQVHLDYVYKDDVSTKLTIRSTA